MDRLRLTTGIMFSLKLFGGVSLSTEGGPITGPAAQRRRLALLSVLASGPAGGVGREKLIGYLWPETNSEQARRFLADSVYTLRKALGQEAILAQGDTLRLNPTLIRSDVGEFREALARGDRQAAVALHEGPLLDGFFLPGAPELERWAEATRERYARDFAQALEALAMEREREADLRGAVECWRRLATYDPYSSPVALRLMLALEASGDPGGAVQHARVHEALLREMLEVEPDAEVTALADRLRSAAASATSRPHSGVSPLQRISSRPAGPQATLTPPADADRPAEGDGQEPAMPPFAAPDRTPTPGHPSHPAAEGTWPRRPRRWVMGAGAGLLLVAAVGAAVFVRGTPAPESRRVFVTVFDNQTGDPALDPIGLMASDWIARGLLETGSVEVVSPPTILDGEGNGGIPALARAAGAGTVISGAYYLEGGVLRFQAQVTNIVRGSLLQTLEPMSVPADSATAGVELLRQQVAAALAARFDRSQELREVTTRSQPPTYAAYTAYIEGIELFGVDPPQAISRFDRAWALDPNFHPARLYAILAHTQFGSLARADSMIQELALHREALTQFERAFLERSRADLAGEREAALRAARRMAELAPGSQFILGHAAQAVWANRPREAVEALGQLDRGFDLIPGHASEDFLTTARHMLGEHRRELQGARRARVQYPELRTFWWEVRALAALGRGAQVERLLQESLSLPPQPGWTPADVMREAGAELRAHGHATAAARAFENALAWYASRPAGDRPGHRPALARTLYEAGRWAEARSILNELAAEQPENVEVLGRLGTLAARQGEREEAEQISAALGSSTQPYLRGANTLWRARIAAQLGQGERALHLLREALAQGQPHGLWLHTDQDLEPLGVPGSVGFPP